MCDGRGFGRSERPKSTQTALEGINNQQVKVVYFFRSTLRGFQRADDRDLCVQQGLGEPEPKSSSPA
jgi:hypothetical protein